MKNWKKWKAAVCHLFQSRKDRAEKDGRLRKFLGKLNNKNPVIIIDNGIFLLKLI